MENCLFCKIAKGEILADLLFENDDFVAFKDINPKAPVHILIIPKKHISSISAVEDNDKDFIGQLILIARDIAQAKNLTSYRLVTNSGSDAGQSVDHLHFHLLGGSKLGDIA